MIVIVGALGKLRLSRCFTNLSRGVLEDRDKSSLGKVDLHGKIKGSDKEEPSSFKSDLSGLLHRNR